MHRIFITFLVFLFTAINCYGHDWISGPSKTDYKPGAGLTGAAGATSGFFQAPN